MRVVHDISHTSQEREAIAAHAAAVDEQMLSAPQRRVKLWEKAATTVIRSFF